MNKYGCIYKLTNKKNGKAYIGQTIILDKNDLPSKRWAKYKRFNCKGQPKLYNALKKYHPNNFSFEVIEYCYSKKEIDCRECYWMGKYDTIAEGYNIREGGSRGGKKHSLETREKLSLALKGRKKSQEHKEKLSLALKGRKKSQEHKEKLYLAMKGNTWNKGCKHSPETREKMSQARKTHLAKRKAKIYGRNS